MKVTLIANDTMFIYNLRREILAKLVADGHEVTVLAQFLSHEKELEAIGCKLYDLPISRRGANPVDDVILLWKFLVKLRKLQPDVVLTNNIKPNVYAGMACRILGIRYIPNITGLGTAVEYPGKLQQLTTFLYKIGVAGAESIFFQNEENLRFFKDRGMMPKKAKIHLLPGSGVNLQTHPLFPYIPEETIHFLYVARLLKEKGIELLLNAAERIARNHSNVIFHICGGCDDEKYLESVRKAEEAGYLQYHGQQKDMVPFFRQAHCVVHPSYYPEGMSNVLQEAAASGRPVIATDRSGCRETVDPGISGYLIPIKDEDALVEALEDFLNQSWESRRAMGEAGRRKMEREFDRQIVVKMVTDEVNVGHKQGSETCGLQKAD